MIGRAVPRIEIARDVALALPLQRMTIAAPSNEISQPDPENDDGDNKCYQVER
ncbi:hypothetical protein ACX40Y_07200 [Sphingomonas sp. RS6]